jgi:hexosaminidase
MNQVPVIPYPNSVNVTGEIFSLENRTRILINEVDLPELEGMVKFLNSMMVNTLGARLEVTKISTRDPQIILRINKDLVQLGEEGYHLVINKKRILIESASIQGVFYGIQSLRQLLPVEGNQVTVGIKFMISRVFPGAACCWM